MSVMDQVWSRLQLVFAQARVTRVGADKVQIRVLDEEVLDVRRVTPYGFSHHPPGGEAYVAFVAGDRAQGIALVVGDKRYSMSLASGEVAIHDAEGNYVLIKAGGVVEVKASTRVVADCPEFETTGNVLIGGSLVVMGDAHAGGAMSDGVGSMGAMRAVFDGHKHGSSPLPDRSMS